MRILIVRLSALGDVIMASGLIPALKARWPEAQLSWLVEPAAAPLLRAHPQLAELILWPRQDWQAMWRDGRRRALWEAFRSLRGQLRARRFDLVLDAQGLLKSGLWSWLSGAPRRISLIGREGSHWLATERVPDWAGPGPRPLGAEYRALARHLGCPAGSFQPSLVPGPAAEAAADAALQAARAGAGGGPATPLAVLAPFTTRPQKHWFEDDWIALARLAQAEGRQPVWLGGPADREAAVRLAAAVPGSLNLAGALKLDASLALIARAAVMVGVDTGLTHAGHAFGVPTVAIFGSTTPYLDPVAPRSQVLHSGRACAPCRRHPSCEGRFDCMRDHRPEAVWAQARALQARPAGTTLLRSAA